MQPPHHRTSLLRYTPPSLLGYQAEALIAGADPEWRTMILVAMRTGMRMGELLGLRWEDVDLSAGRINVRQSYVDGYFVLPKSGKPREISIGQDVIDALGIYRHERGPLVFCDTAGQVLMAGAGPGDPAGGGEGLAKLAGRPAN